MELINQHTKAIMEGCKQRARDAGLTFTDESLEYIVTNRDLLELSPKLMIPTLYDYWVHDVEVLREKGKYELYPHNPYETVINTRPPISFYNDNNPDWLNVMIFYHVIGHIDFFQNNLFFRQTWDYDFNGEALSDKRLIARLRGEKGRWVEYVIEFARALDNLVDFHGDLTGRFAIPETGCSPRLNFFFDSFLQTEKKVSVSEYMREVDHYNRCIRDYGEAGEKTFFHEAGQRYAELEARLARMGEVHVEPRRDLLRFLLDDSPFLARDENVWMRSVLEIIRKTSLFFQPQIRTKIMNEGWASYWHEKLFLQDDRIKGHEVDFARVHAGVTSLPRIGMNPYAIGMRLFSSIEEKAEKGRDTFDYERLADADARKKYDTRAGRGNDAIFRIRENLSDFLFLKNHLDQDFMDKHRLFVAGKRLDTERNVWQYYVKSRKLQDFRDMIMNSLYHPPVVTVNQTNVMEGELYLVHKFEGKQLVQEYIANTMVAIEFLWGGTVHLETSEAEIVAKEEKAEQQADGKEEIRWNRVLYTMRGRKLSKTPFK